MRNTFYHWFLLAMLFAMFFGAEVARAAAGHMDLYLIISYCAIGVFASAGAIESYKEKGNHHG